MLNVRPPSMWYQKSLLTFLLARNAMIIIIIHQALTWSYQQPTTATSTHLPTESKIHFGWLCSSSRIFYYWNIGEQPSSMQLFLTTEFIFLPFRCRWRFGISFIYSIFYYFCIFFAVVSVSFGEWWRLSHRRLSNRTLARIIFRIINFTAPVVNLINGTKPAK